jgi:hypothetical protein
MRNKDKSISNIIKFYKDFIKQHQVEIIDFWEADLYAIGFKKQNKIVYLNTHLSSMNEMKIHYDLEVENLNTDIGFRVIESGMVNNYNDLSDVIYKHLSIRSL